MLYITLSVTARHFSTISTDRLSEEKAESRLCLAAVSRHNLLLTTAADFVLGLNALFSSPN